MDNSEKTISFFLTGGFDSTYMLCRLSRERSETLKPIYALNPKRKSTEQELKTIKKIIKLVKSKPETKAKIEDIEIIALKNLKVDKTIHKTRRYLSKRVGSLGYQYDYLATIAKHRQEKIGLGLENAPDSMADVGAVATIRKFGKLRKQDGIFELDPEKSSSKLKVVFDNMRFPVIDKTEIEMKQDFSDWGYDDIMKCVWFCHSPIKESPCGLCRPCEEKMNSNMDSLLPDIAKTRFKKAQKYKKLFGETISRKIKNLKLFFLRHF